MAEYIGCGKEHANRIKRLFFEKHPEKANPIEKAILALLEQNPMFSAKEISILTHCSEKTVKIIKKKYTKAHEKIITSTRAKSIKDRKIAFNLLNKTPALKIKALAQLINCSEPQAWRHKKAWLQLHSAEPPQEETSAD